MLKFQTRSGGTADIKIESAVIHTAGENEEEFVWQLWHQPMSRFPVKIRWGTLRRRKVRRRKPEKKIRFPDIPTVMEVPVEEQTYYLVDLSQYTPENIDFQYDTGTITYQGTEVAAYLSANGDISFVYLADKSKKPLPVRL